MSGTKAGGLKAAETNKKKYGDNFYAEIGRKGGKACTTKGFGANRELARLAGAKGGTISRRGPATKPRKDKGVPHKRPIEEPIVEVKPPKKRFWKWPWSK